MAEGEGIENHAVTLQPQIKYNMENRRINLAVVFGSRSVEHEVSVVTALQILENADKEKYNLIPLYIDKLGKWHTGQALLDIQNYKDPQELLAKVAEGYLYDSKINTNSPVPFVKTSEKIDVVFPAVHGTFGEDGTIQGLLEMSGIPYVGAGVTGSAVGMDKVLQKDILRQNGIPVPDYQLLLREDWEKTRKIKVKFPAVVKPANLGSSVAVTKVRNQKELEMAIDLAAQFDRRIIIEECLENVIEINCSVLGYKTLEASVCEQPVKSTDLLSYEDKYLKGSKTKGMASLSRLIPAPIPTALTKKIQETAKKVFRILDASGVARIDFFVDVKKNKIWVCEINTLPGSISFYLWEKSGYPFPKLVDKLVELAYERFNDRKKTQYSFSSNLLQTLGKGAKGTKN
jgi:D-alanine-D-alanine ligase